MLERDNGQLFDFDIDVEPGIGQQRDSARKLFRDMLWVVVEPRLLSLLQLIGNHPVVPEPF